MLYYVIVSFSTHVTKVIILLVKIAVRSSVGNLLLKIAVRSSIDDLLLKNSHWKFYKQSISLKKAVTSYIDNLLVKLALQNFQRQCINANSRQKFYRQSISKNSRHKFSIFNRTFIIETRSSK